MFMMLWVSLPGNCTERGATLCRMLFTDYLVSPFIGVACGITDDFMLVG